MKSKYNHEEENLHKALYCSEEEVKKIHKITTQFLKENMNQIKKMKSESQYIEFLENYTLLLEDNDIRRPIRINALLSLQKTIMISTPFGRNKLNDLNLQALKSLNDMMKE